MGMLFPRDSLLAQTEIHREDTQEKELATHSSILAWRIPWTHDLEHYSPWGHRVGHS